MVTTHDTGRVQLALSLVFVSMGGWNGGFGLLHRGRSDKIYLWRIAGHVGDLVTSAAHLEVRDRRERDAPQPIGSFNCAESLISMIYDP